MAAAYASGVWAAALTALRAATSQAAAGSSSST
jgi:hypothetical protein